MRVIKIQGVKTKDRKVRQVRAAAWPVGNVVAVEVGADRGPRSVRWVALKDGKELARKELPVRGAPGAALSADLVLLAYVIASEFGHHVLLEKTDDPEQKAVDLISWGKSDDPEDYERVEYLSLAMLPDGSALRASRTDGALVGWRVGEA